MSAQLSDGAFERLPDRPDLRHLRNQARDLLRDGACASLAEAQNRIARKYGFPNWPKLKVHVQTIADRRMGALENAILEEDIRRLEKLIREDPDQLHRVGPWVKWKPHNDLRPLCYAAMEARLRAMKWLIDAGADVHAGKEHALKVVVICSPLRTSDSWTTRRGSSPRGPTSASSTRSGRVKARWPPRPAMDSPMYASCCWRQAPIRPDATRKDATHVMPPGAGSMKRWCGCWADDAACSTLESPTGSGFRSQDAQGRIAVAETDQAPVKTPRLNPGTSEGTWRPWCTSDPPCCRDASGRPGR